MMVSEVFINQMSRLDRALYVVLDKSLERYVIYRRDRKYMPRKILVVEDDNGNFSRPNYKHLAKLYEMDSWRHPNFVQALDDHNAEVEKDMDRKMHRLHEEESLLLTRSAYF